MLECAGKIVFDEQSRLEFDQLRNIFKTENKAALFAKQYRYAANPHIYAISPLGTYNIGQTIDFMNKCKELNIQTTLDNKLKPLIYPKLNISQIEQVPNSKFTYRYYQENLLQSLCKSGRGVIISPTRSGKSIILAGLCHNIFLNTYKNNINNILIIVPNVQLVEQMKADFTEYYTVNNYKKIYLENGKVLILSNDDEIETVNRGKISVKELTDSDELK